MDVAARVSSKGQITIPKHVRDALGLGEGDAVVFRVDGERAVLARTPELLAAAGSVDVPIGRSGASWSEIRQYTRQSRAAAGR